MRLLIIAIAFSVVSLIACNEHPADGKKEPPVNVPDAIPVINFGVARTWAHDTNSFTEGLLVHDGKLYESTGSPDDLPDTRSLLGVLDINTGKIAVKVELDRQKYFGEGIVFLNGKFYQLTYKTKVGFVYDAVTFKKTGQFTLPSEEGWGMTTDGTYLIMSDSTNMLIYLDPVTFKVVKKLPVTENNTPVMQVNELEYIKGFIYANVYTKDYIIKIDPASGKVVGKLDLNALANEARSRYSGSLELNGIAYDSVSNKVYVTGKMWPTLYEIQFNH
jgi:glutamine cyclotransferase